MKTLIAIFADTSLYYLLYLDWDLLSVVYLTVATLVPLGISVLC